MQKETTVLLNNIVINDAHLALEAICDLVVCYRHLVDMDTMTLEQLLAAEDARSKYYEHAPEKVIKNRSDCLRDLRQLIEIKKSGTLVSR